MIEDTNFPIRNAAAVTEPFWDAWLKTDADKNVIVFSEKIGARDSQRKAIIKAVADHFTSIRRLEAAITRLGFARSVSVLRNSLPSDIRTQSGDLGEILCTEYIIQKTNFRVPVKKLRWKDDRNLAMRGNDVLAFGLRHTRKLVLKVESKSRASLYASTIVEAEKGLFQNDGRPNPSSIAFIVNRLEEEGRYAESDFVSSLLQDDFSLKNIEHMIFVLSGNPPQSVLDKSKTEDQKGIIRFLVGVHVEDHQDFIAQIFSECVDGAF